MKKIIILLLFIVSSSVSFGQRNLTKMSEEKRNEILKNVARKIVKDYGPDYNRGIEPVVLEANEESVRLAYEGYNNPEFTHLKYQDEWCLKAMKGVAWYRVCFPYDKEKEDWGEFVEYACEVWIWADNHKPFKARFGVIGEWELDKPGKKVNVHKLIPKSPPKSKAIIKKRPISEEEKKLLGLKKSILLLFSV